MLLNKLKRIGKVPTILLFIFSLIVVVLLVSAFVGLSSRDRSIILQKQSSLEHNGIERKYLVSKASNITKDTRIIVGLHGYGDSARRFAYYTGLHNAAKSNDIIIYPETVLPLPDQKTGWNAGYCCGSGWKQNIDDAGFITTLVESIKKQFSLEDPQVLVTGFSNGAFMSYRLATDYPDMINGIATMSGSIGTEEKRLNPKSPIPALLMHGKKDATVPFDGGANPSDPEFVWLPFAETLNTWESVNGTTAPTKQILYPEIGHIWNDWRIVNFWHSKPQASIEVFNFFNEL